ncbi:hypothetical protein M440DRAFT_344797 [Trichoderma longibrachiatum ATCC 18648]|uniref:Uncharacterized protein n=1 Tax=Trichoderma longibrachiatum ATCC 18648 TaxID=983965 RepID=A0A2T4CJK1_TRILO|nr:hypothetical protein M440DRAFT_344797 [Trichoderma longibrachiatum ATCC 18648]
MILFSCDVVRPLNVFVQGRVTLTTSKKKKNHNSGFILTFVYPITHFANYQQNETPSGRGHGLCCRQVPFCTYTATLTPQPSCWFYTLQLTSISDANGTNTTAGQTGSSGSGAPSGSGGSSSSSGSGGNSGSSSGSQQK